MNKVITLLLGSSRNSYSILKSDANDSNSYKKQHCNYHSIAI